MAYISSSNDSEFYEHIYRRESARMKYLPGQIKQLIIVESPPTDESNRFFYYEHYEKNQDLLYVDTMRAIFDKNEEDEPEIRCNKTKYLGEFRNKGLYLIDSLDTNIGKKSDLERQQVIGENYDNKVQRNSLFCKIDRLIPSNKRKETQIILVKYSVYEALYSRLVADEFFVINEKIPFPRYPKQRKTFREKLSKIVNDIRWPGT